MLPDVTHTTSQEDTMTSSGLHEHDEALELEIRIAKRILASVESKSATMAEQWRRKVAELEAKRA